jgi:hypothetical protein
LKTLKKVLLNTIKEGIKKLERIEDIREKNGQATSFILTVAQIIQK